MVLTAGVRWIPHTLLETNHYVDYILTFTVILYSTEFWLLLIKLLEIWDRAQRKAARRRRSDCRDNFGRLQCRAQQSHQWRMNLRQLTKYAHSCLGCVKMRACNFLFVYQSSPSFFFQRGRGCSWSTTFPIFDMWIRSGDIWDQSVKLYEIGANFACFGPPIYFGEAHPNFWTCIIKRTRIAIMWQSFTAIGRWSSEISWRKKQESLADAKVSARQPCVYEGL